MVQRKCECVCTEVAHPEYRFNNEAVGLFVHIDHTEAVKNLWVGGCKQCVYGFVDCGSLCSASSLSVDVETFAICEKCMAGMTVDHMGVGYILTLLQQAK